MKLLAAIWTKYPATATKVYSYNSSGERILTEIQAHTYIQIFFVVIPFTINITITTIYHYHHNHHLLSLSSQPPPSFT